MKAIETGTYNVILRTISEEIKPQEMKHYVKLGKEMIKYIKEPKNKGVGLAAPQVGENKRLIVVSLLRDRDDENYSTVMMLNPEILDFSKDTETDTEGCLSVPGGKAEVCRPKSIRLKYIDEKGKERILMLDGLSARIVQHEVDHLNGVLFVDRVNETILKQRKKEAVL
ncbi:MAG: peptide deformylase [Candidatus Peribacteria bacterium]|nr:MAG: peptide deformylase [Candidatus Peribacteria bacterium]